MKLTDKELKEKYLELLADKRVANVKLFYGANSGRAIDLESDLRPTEELMEAMKSFRPILDKDFSPK